MQMPHYREKRPTCTAIYIQLYTHVQDIIVVRLLARRREEIIRIYVCLHATMVF
jgi:hypothetical protein